MTFFYKKFQQLLQDSVARVYIKNPAEFLGEETLPDAI